MAGWPNCAVEERYSFCPSGTSGAYQRLTSSSGSDIRSFGAIQVFGADQKADGSWTASLAFLLNGKTPGVDPPTFYTWQVGQNGIANGLYWGPGSDPRNGDPATQAIGPLQYVRGVGDGDC